MLVISIHGAEDVIADQAVALRGGQGSYDSAAIDQMFGRDQQFTEWRDRSGPTRVVLNACQVSAALEGAIIRALTRPNSGQAAQGLGQGCRPDTEVRYYKSSRDVEIRTRQQYTALPLDEKEDMLNLLQELNRQWGYFGSPPVDKSLVLDYYFDEPPKGGWPVVKVTHDRRDIGISFYDRAAHREFLQSCNQGFRLRQHQPRAPSLRTRP